MGKRRYAGTSIKGAEPRVRFNIQRRADGSLVKEHAMSGVFLQDQDGEGNSLPLVHNRLIFQCEHGADAAHWQGVAAIGWGRGEGSVQVRCDICRFQARLRQSDLAGLLVLATDPDFVATCPEGLAGVGKHDGRPGAYYAIVNLKAAPELAKIWRRRLAEGEGDE